MFPSTKEVTFGEKKILCYDFTFGYMLGLQDGTVEDTIENGVVNGTDLSMDEVLELRASQVNELFQVILKLSYPSAYDEDGNLKKEPEDVDGDNKKKV